MSRQKYYLLFVIILLIGFGGDPIGGSVSASLDLPEGFQVYTSPKFTNGSPVDLIENEIIAWILDPKVHKTTYMYPALARDIVQWARGAPYPFLMLAIGSAESSFDPRAVSTANCLSIWQINPINLKELCEQGIACTKEELFDPEINFKASVYILNKPNDPNEDNQVTMDDKLDRYYGLGGQNKFRIRYRDRVKARLGHLWSMYYYSINNPDAVPKDFDFDFEKGPSKLLLFPKPYKVKRS